MEKCILLQCEHTYASKLLNLLDMIFMKYMYFLHILHKQRVQNGMTNVDCTLDTCIDKKLQEGEA